MIQYSFWRSGWLISTLLTLLFLAAHLTEFAPIQNLELKAYDLAVQAKMQPADELIAIVSIDDNSVSRLGRWPWPQEILADVVNKLSNAGAKLIGLDIFYNKSALPDEKQELADAVKRSGSTLLPIYLWIGHNPNPPTSDIPAYISRMSMISTAPTDDKASPLAATNMRFSFPQLSEAAAGIGHFTLQPDSDGIVRSEPLAIAYAGHLYPSISLVQAGKHQNIPIGDIRISTGTDIEFGAINIPAYPHLQLLPMFHGDSQGGNYATYSFHDIYSGNISPDMFSNKIVLIGFTATELAQTYATPVNSQMADVEFNAHVLQSILDETFFKRPLWADRVELLLLLVIGFYLILLLPRLTTKVAVTASLALLLLLVASNFILLTGSMIWLQTISAACLLFFGHALHLARDYSIAVHRQPEDPNPDSTNKTLALSFQGQGMLDMAFEKLRKCTVNDEILTLLYNLGLDFERKRHLHRAISVFEYIDGHRADYRDVRARLILLRNAQEEAFQSGKTAGIPHILFTSDNRPMLGRYEVIREIGKGAMGTVYLGQDPKINRRVAIKTMALSEEFEASELEGVKKRFFHEAEVAGMLNHPNIVTIYDVGEEHDLAYIAMEFLDGEDLTPFTKKPNLLPATTTLKIIAKVADALKYAHKRGVVHRDIKPANIMILKNKVVKVTDFGIAHISEESKIKGVAVMGSPAYMSPEQLAGKILDGRSDLFSLGVTLYELLTGERPFRGETLTKLVFKIAKESHPNIRQKCPGLPECIYGLIDGLLHKNSAERIGSSDEVIEALLQGLQQLNKGGQSSGC